jgi:hypothetical protein
VTGQPIRFTAHALDKLKEEKERGFDVDEELATGILLRPSQVVPARAGRKFAQSPIDERHLLRVLFEEESAGLVIITVYIGARKQYEI